MKAFRRSAMALVASGCTLASGGAVAQASSWAELGPLQVTVVDLLPDDGIAPTFRLNAGGVVLQEIATDQDPYQRRYADVWGGALFKSYSIQANSTHASASGSITGTGQFEGLGFRLDSQAEGGTTGNPVGANTATSRVHGLGFNSSVTLGYGTQVILQAHYDVGATVEANALQGNVPDSASAEIWLWLWGYDGSRHQNSFPTASAGVTGTLPADGAHWQQGAVAQHASGTLVSSFRNLGPTGSDVTANLNIFGRANAEAHPVVSVVPEPATWMLMLAGGFVVAFIAMRSRS